ncbi:insulinase family protein [candidate division KSB1 bacterium]|nr:MAG: insulinase family protein [candidate division KSB1 bacterium]
MGKTAEFSAKRTSMKKALCLGFCAAILLFAAVAGAATLPEIKFEKYVLPNGLDVILYEDHSLPNVTVNTWYHVGSKNERPGRTGFAHLFEHMMFEGSEHHPTDYSTDAFGGYDNGSTNEDRTNYFSVVPSNYLEYVLWLEADRMGYLLPAMTLEDLNTQRDVVKNERRQRVDNTPYAKADELLLPAIFPPQHPYVHSIIGSMEDLSVASLEDVQNFFKTYYTPNNASLCIAGDFNTAQVKGWVEKYYGSIPAGKPIDRIEAWVPELDGVTRLQAEDNITLPRLYCAWPAPPRFSKDEAALVFLSNILDDGKSSRLYKSLVYEKQIAQDVTAFLDNMEITGVFYIVITAREGHTLDEIEKAMDEVLQEVRTKGVTPTELTPYQTDWEASFVRSLQRVGGFGSISDRLNLYNTYLGEPNKFQWHLDTYMKTTAADISQAARKYLDPDKRVLLHLVPQGDLTAMSVDVDRTKEPAPAADPTFTPPQIKQAQLANGVPLYLVEKHNLPLVQINMVFKGGYAMDPLDKAGLAALTTDMLDEGTKTRTSIQISDDLPKIGADLNTGASWDGMTVGINVLKSKLSDGLAILTDVLINPTFPQEELDRVKQSQIGTIQQQARQPYAAAFKAFGRLLYGPQHPYGQPHTGTGTEASVNAITRDDVVNFYKNYFALNNTAFVVVGDISLEEAKTTLEKAFGNWKPNPSKIADIPAPAPLAATKIYIVDKPGAPQSVIVLGNLGMKRSDPEYTTTDVMNQALGGGSIARLYLNLREKNGYTYGAYSGFSSRRGVAPFSAYAQVQTEVTDKAVVEFMKELRDIRGPRPLTADELKASKDNLIKGYSQNFETFNALAAQLNTIFLQSLPLTEWTDYSRTVGGVTVEEATRLAKAHINPDALLIVVVGDKEKIEAPLRALNLGEVTVVKPELL